ncbi:ankyrin repeat domain-containing protein [Rhabdochlamydiaceae symbiont of Dictyostelium giganteum]|uniref:ankyrin repeat domain-containing protein n=1 Tax=Rhabdochlamydiaceae symbiont of Dictyostelium giganteum TaxID=3342349 RepID=UPI00384C3401
MSTSLTNISYKNSQVASSINSSLTSFTSSLPQGMNVPSSDLRSTAISSIQKEKLRSLMKTYGFEDAFIQAVPEESLQNDQHLADYLFHIILYEMKPDVWDALVYDKLLELYDLQGMNLAFAAIREGKKGFFSYLIGHYPVDSLMELKGLEGREELRGKTLLHLVAIYGREDMLGDLLQGNSGIVNVKDKDARGLTALHWAIHEGHEKVLQRLLEYGISGQEWRNGKTMISLIALAVTSGYPNILELLLKHNQFKDISLLDAIPDIKTVLHLAIHSNQPQMLTYLLNDKHIIIKHILEIKDRSGRTPLQLAAFLGDLFAIKALVDTGAYIHKGELEKSGTTLHFAVKGKQPDAITLLLSLKADPNKTDEAGKTPLAYLQGKEAEHAVIKRCKNILENSIASIRSEKIKEADFYESAPFNLILEGSYHQKEGFIGIIKGLGSKKILKEIRRFSGLGMGSIIATLLALGYTSSQIKELSFNSLQDLFTINSSLTDVQFKELEDLYLPPSSEKKRLDFSIALCTTEELRSSLEEVINHQVKIENLSFKELAEKIQRYPEKYRHIHLTAYSLTKGKIIHFSSENPEYGDFLLSDVLAATLAFPGIFKPLILRRKNSDGDLYDDTTYGKMIAPSTTSLVDRFDDHVYQEDPYYKGKQTNYRTLALKIDHQEAEKETILQEMPLVSRLIDLYINQAKQRNPSEEISRGRIKKIVLSEEDNDHMIAAEKKVECLFSSAKKSLLEKHLPSTYLGTKNNLIPWKYDIFLKNHSLSHESLLPKQSSCINNIPQREIFFTGRVKELHDLKTMFASSSKVAIAGLGGIGKSTLSFKYALELARYRFIYLIKATASGAIRIALIELAGLLNIKKEKHEETLAELRVYLQQMTLPGLFVIDGLDDEHFFTELKNYIPDTNRCQILISTRVGDKAHVNGFKVIPLIEFSEEEAIHYLTQVDQPVQEEKKAAETLAKAVGYHPLALSHIARYLEQENISLCEYERRFKARDPKLPGKDDIDLPTEEASIFITWQVSLDAIKEKEKGFLAIEMMQMIALLGEEDIPLDLLHAWAHLSYPQEDEVSILGAIKLLKGYSFFREIIGELDQKKYYQVHSLVQKVMELSIKEKKDIFFKKTCISINHTIKQLREPSYSKNNYFDQKLEILYRAHLSRLYGMTNLFEALENHQKIQFLSHLGWAYSRYVSPRNIAHQYIDQGIALLDQNSLKLFKSDGTSLLNDRDINSLDREEALIAAELYQIKSRCIRYTESTEEAIILAEKALMIRKQLLNHDNPYLLESYDAVIWLLHDREEFEKELPFVREALEIKMKTLDENHPETLKSRSRIVTILYDIAENQEENKEALKHAKILLESREKISKTQVDNDFDGLFQSYDTVITILIRLEHYQGALDYANIVLKLKLDILGDSNNEILDAYDTVIDILLRLKNYPEAFFLAQEELKNRIRFITEPDGETNESYGRFIYLLGNVPLNENMILPIQELVDQLGSSFGEDHDMTLALYNETMKFILKAKNEEYFLYFTKHRLDKQRQQLGENHPKTLNSYQKILKFLCDSQKEIDALTFARCMLENQNNTLEKTLEARLKSYDVVIKALNDLMPNKETSSTYSQEKLQIYEKIMGVLKNSRQKDDKIFEFQQNLYIAQQIPNKENDTPKKNYFDSAQCYISVITLLKNIGSKIDIGATEQSIVAQHILEAKKTVLKEGDEVIHLLNKIGQQEEALILAQHLLKARKAVLENKNQLIFENYKIIINFFETLKQKKEAFAIAQKQLDTSIKTFGEKDYRTSMNYKLVIDLFKEVETKEDALVIARKRLDKTIETFGKTDYRTSMSYELVVDLFKVFGQKEKALAIAQNQLYERIKKFGETDSRTSVSYKLVINLFKDLDQKEEALAIAQNQLYGRIKKFGETDSQTSVSYKLVIDLFKILGRKEEALAIAQKQLDARIKELGETDSLTSESYQLVINLFKDLDQKDKALAMAQKQLDARIKELGETDSCTSESYQLVINIFKDLDQKEEALAIAQKQLDARIKELGETNSRTSESYQLVINLFKDLDQKEEALAIAQKQLDARIKELGETDSRTSESYQLVINLFKDLDHKDKALAMAQNQLYGRIKKFGETDSQTSVSYKLVIDLFKILGRKEEALAIAQKQLDARIKELGETDSRTSESYQLVINLFKDLDQKEEALAIAQKQLDARIKELGETDSRTSESYQLVINLFKDLDQKEEALAIAQKQLDARIKELGETDFQTSVSYQLVINLFKDLDQKEEALAIAQKQLDARIKELGETDFQTSVSYQLVINLFKDLDQKDKALAMAQKQLDARIKELGETDSRTSESYQLVINLFKDLDQKEEALAIAQKQLDARIKELGETNSRTSESYQLVIDLLKGLKRNEEALTTAQKQLNGRIKELGEVDFRTAISYQLVIDLLKSLERNEEALAIAQKQLDERIKKFGETDYQTSESYQLVIDLFKEFEQKEEALTTAQKQLDARIKQFGETDYRTSESYQLVNNLLKECEKKEVTPPDTPRILERGKIDRCALS